MKYAGTIFHHLSFDSSDHCPLCIVPDSMEITSFTKPFHFEEMWLADQGCSKVVEAVWSSSVASDPTIQVMRKIENCGKELKRLNLVHFGNVKRKLEKKRKLLKGAEHETMQTR